MDLTTLFPGQFAIEQVVAESEQRVLMKARDLVLNRHVALRVHLGEDTRRAWFLRESETLAMLDHPSIRRVYAAGMAGGYAWRSGNWIDGECLADAVARRPRPIPVVLSIARDLLYACDHAHVRGVVMRRIRPTTLMIDTSGRAVVTDLRYANRVLDMIPADQRRDDHPFMAPEVRGGQPGDPGADVYAVGAALFYALTGAAPEPDIASVTALRPQCPVVLERIVVRALSKRPDKRYATAADMLAELAADTDFFTEPGAGPPSLILPDSPAWERRLRRAFGDHYELLAEIGHGSFGRVYRVRDLALEREVALKVLDPRLTQDPAIAEGFHHEARLAASLQHPNIVSIHDIDGRLGLLWYTMELVEGESVAQLVAREGPLSVARTVELISDALFALEHAHAKRLVHRDIKPENLLVGRTGAVHITDFGLALALPRGRLFGGATSRSGTPQFAAPEQLAGGQVDQRSDLFSLGAVGYFALLGEPPFSERTAEAVRNGQVGFTLPDLQASRDDVPELLEWALRRACAFEPSNRFATSADFRDALEAAGFHTGERPVPDDDRSTFLRRLRHLF